MENKINDSCDKKRGCHFYILTTDRRIEPIYSKVFSKRYDLTKVLPLAYISLDEKLAKKRQI